MKEMSIVTVMKILDAAAEDWKLDMLTHIFDYGIDGNKEPYVNCKDSYGRYWYLDLDGIYTQGDTANGD